MFFLHALFNFADFVFSWFLKASSYTVITRFIRVIHGLHGRGRAMTCRFVDPNSYFFVLVSFLKNRYTESMLILGIDPGLQKTGWGIIHSEGHRLEFRASGLIKTNVEDTLAERLATLHHGLSAVVRQWAPASAAVEETFVNKNPASALKLGQARGVVLAVPAIHGLPVAEYAANKVKKSIVGTGHAAKEQMVMMVRMLLPACGQISEDEADALAVAICHAHYGTMRVLEKKLQTN